MAILIFLGENKIIGKIIKYPASKVKANPFRLYSSFMNIPVLVFNVLFQWVTLIYIDLRR